MSFQTTIVPVPRSELRYLPEKRRKDTIANAIHNLSPQVIESATRGKAFHLVEIKKSGSTGGQWPPPYIPTTDDLVEGFKAKFPDCKVEYTEIWEDTQPGVRQQKSGILVDWS